MGMYTELVCAFKLKQETPKDIIDILRFMARHEDIEEYELNIPDDEFFKCARWKWLFTSDSYYFSGDTHSTVRYDDISKSYYVTIRSNLKNYDDEIHKFLKWIKPYISYSDEFIGYSRYEECSDPELIYVSKIE